MNDVVGNTGMVRLPLPFLFQERSSLELPGICPVRQIGRHVECESEKDRGFAVLWISIVDLLHGALVSQVAGVFVHRIAVFVQRGKRLDPVTLMRGLLLRAAS